MAKILKPPTDARSAQVTQIDRAVTEGHTDNRCGTDSMEIELDGVLAFAEQRVEIQLGCNRLRR